MLYICTSSEYAGGHELMDLNLGLEITCENNDEQEVEEEFDNEDEEEQPETEQSVEPATRR